MAQQCRNEVRFLCLWGKWLIRKFGGTGGGGGLLKRSRASYMVSLENVQNFWRS